MNNTTRCPRATPSLYAQVQRESKRTPKGRLQNGGESFYVIEASVLPVEWIEGVRCNAFVPEYGSVGAIPGIFHDRLSNDARLKQALSQCVPLSIWNRGPQEVEEHARFTSVLLLKLLRRGRTPLSTLSVGRGYACTAL